MMSNCLIPNHSHQTAPPAEPNYLPFIFAVGDSVPLMLVQGIGATTNIMEISIFFSMALRSRCSIILGLVSCYNLVSCVLGFCLGVFEVLFVNCYVFGTSTTYHLHTYKGFEAVLFFLEQCAGYTLAKVALERCVAVRNPLSSPPSLASDFTGAALIGVALGSSSYLAVDPFRQLRSLMPHKMWIYISGLTRISVRLISAAVITVSYIQMLYYLARADRTVIRRTTCRSRNERTATKTVIIITMLYLLLITLPQTAYEIYIMRTFNDIGSAGFSWSRPKVYLYFLGLASPDTIVYLLYNARFRRRFLQLFCSFFVRTTSEPMLAAGKSPTGHRTKANMQRPRVTHQNAVIVAAQVRNGDCYSVMEHAVAATDFSVTAVDIEKDPNSVSEVKDTCKPMERYPVEEIETFA